MTRGLHEDEIEMEPLARFYEFLSIARARLAYLEKKWPGDAPESNWDATDDNQNVRNWP